MLQALEADSQVSAGMLASLGKLSEAARQRLDPSTNVRAYIDALCRDDLFGDVLDVLTHLLPRQYAIAWGCECLQALRGATPDDPTDKAAFSAAQRWLSDPSEENRRSALVLADRLGYKTAAAWLAAAAGWTGGSMLAEGPYEVPVAATLSGDAVGTAVRLAAAADPKNFDAHIRESVERALAAFGAGRR